MNLWPRSDTILCVENFTYEAGASGAGPSPALLAPTQDQSAKGAGEALA